ncbi:LysR family transcriptional regulator [Terrabacter sp. MAHUQ-38]|uniref:LysR family transcriptional regulator n=1 Tax=unclassified Terrabacter TaxID=2630222 RepID=UPI00165E387F|nr:LysR family transcriptional regulator [Terrabacter sp. MAHUQ-38]
MDTNLLHTFVEVCRKGSISAAAHSLRYTQSGVSRQMAALESELGHVLLIRLPRGVAPTAAGATLLRHAQAVLRGLDRISDALDHPDRGPSTFVVGAIPSAVQALVPQLVAAHTKSHPDTRILVHEAHSPDLMARTATGELDAAIVTDYPPGLEPTADVVLEHVRDDDVHAIVPAGHRLARATTRRLRLEALADEPWIEDHRGSEQTLRQAAHRAGFAPRIEHGCGSLAGKVALVGAGLGVAAVPGILVPALGPEVVARRLVDAPVRAVYLAVHRPASVTAPVATLLATLLDAIGGRTGR